jgi:CHASE2 domain-containing sensor protein
VGTLVYFLVDFFPWWAIPAALILFELSNHFRRRERRLLSVFSALLSITLLVLSVLFVVYGGFQTTRPAMQKIERQYMN